MMAKILAIVLLALTSGFGFADAGANVAIRSFAPDSFNQIKAEYAGKPFVVIVWSLDCAYCAESFAVLAKAQRKYGIKVVTIAMDRIDSKQTSDLMRQKITASGLRSQMWAFGPEPEEKLRYAIDPKWRGEMPRTYWFNAKGEAVAYSGVVTIRLAEKFL